MSSFDGGRVSFDVGHNVRACANWYGNGDEWDRIRFDYGGSPESLVAAGIVTHKQLKPRWTGRRDVPRPKGCNQPRVDAAGNRMSINWRDKRRDYLTISISTSIDGALHVPGFSIAPLLARFRPSARTPFDSERYQLYEARVERAKERFRRQGGATA